MDRPRNNRRPHFSSRRITSQFRSINVILSSNYLIRRTFDEYSSELESGHLSWTPPHQSEDFWRENANKLLGQNYKLLKILARLLATSKNPVVLAVGCHDVGQLVKHVPQAMRYCSLNFALIASQVQSLGAKTRIMELMGHSDPDVRYEALSTVQLLMSGQFL